MQDNFLIEIIVAFTGLAIIALLFMARLIIKDQETDKEIRQNLK